MRNKQKRSKIVVAVVILVAIVFATGCSKVEQAISDAEQGKTTITKEDGKQVTLSGNSDIPDLFPSDVPLPDEIKIVSSISSDDSVTLAFETEMPYDDVVALYFDYTEKAGYTEVHKLEDEEQKYINYSSQKGTERFIFTMQLNLEDNKTVNGSLIYSNKPEAEK